MLHILYIFAYSVFFPLDISIVRIRCLSSLKKRKRRQRITFLSTIILMLIYFFSFGPCQCQSSLTNTHTFPTIINNEKTSRTVWYSPISLFLTRTIIWVSFFSIYIHSQLFFFFAPFSRFFFFFAVCLDHSGRRRRINLREHSTINK